MLRARLVGPRCASPRAAGADQALVFQATRTSTPYTPTDDPRMPTAYQSRAAPALVGTHCTSPSTAPAQNASKALSGMWNAKPRDAKLQIDEGLNRTAQCHCRGPARVSVKCGSWLAQGSQNRGGFLLHVLHWRWHDQPVTLTPSTEDCWQHVHGQSSFSQTSRKPTSLAASRHYRRLW